MSYERPREKQWLIHPALDHPENGEPVSVSESRDRTAKDQMSVIGADIVITGDIAATVDLHIEGRVSGDVRCSTLILGEQSIVNGKIYADRVRVSGKVDGAIDTKDLALEATAQVAGDILYERIRISNGGVLEGHITRKPVDERTLEATEVKLAKPVNQPVNQPSVERIEKRSDKKTEIPPEVKVFE